MYIIIKFIYVCTVIISVTKGLEYYTLQAHYGRKTRSQRKYGKYLINDFMKKVNLMIKTLAMTSS